LPPNFTGYNPNKVKLITTLALVLCFQVSFSQWTRVEQLPATDIFNLFRADTVLYAGGRDVVYFSKNNGQSWDSTAHIAGVTTIDAFIVYKNEFYAGCWNKGVFKSSNKGVTWQNMGNSILPYVSQFTEWNGSLYAATLGGSMYKLNEPSRTSWVSFNNGLSSLSVNLPAVHGHNNVLLAGTLANRLYNRFSITTGAWEDIFITGNNSVGDGVYNFISARDSLFMSTHTNIYYSTDEGLTWSKTGSAFPSLYTPLQNTKQGIIAARNTFNGVTNNTDFFYIKKDNLKASWTPFGSIVDHFAYDFEIIGDKLWEASLHGLNYMSLASLPGFTSPYDSDTIVKTIDPVVPVNPVPVTFPFTVGNVYPNPVNNDGYIAISLNTAKELSATLYDIAGRFISAPVNHLKLNKGKTILPFSIGNISSGTYFLRLAIDDKIFTRKLVHTNR
jgi:hypothetical protein